jgi:hypothetical protein
MRMTMPQIIRDYLRSFDVQKRTAQAAGALSPFRRFSRWRYSRSEPYPYGGWSPWT